MWNLLSDEIFPETKDDYAFVEVLLDNDEIRTAEYVLCENEFGWVVSHDWFAYQNGTTHWERPNVIAWRNYGSL